MSGDDNEKADFQVPVQIVQLVTDDYITRQSIAYLGITW